MAPYPNGQRKRIQNPLSVGSNPTGATITRQSGLPKVVNTDLLVKLPPAISANICRGNKNEMICGSAEND